MPIGTRDPAPRGMTYNEGTYAVDNGAVYVTYRNTDIDGLHITTDPNPPTT